jgi:hypothetical protein
MPENSTVVAALAISAAILLHGYWTSHAQQVDYQLSAAGDGRTVWRMESATGRLSMCGSIITGGAFGQARAQNDAAMLKVLPDQSPDGSAQVLRDMENLAVLASASCSGWSSE